MAGWRADLIPFFDRFFHHKTQTQETMTPRYQITTLGHTEGSRQAAFGGTGRQAAEIFSDEKPRTHQRKWTIVEPIHGEKDA